MYLVLIFTRGWVDHGMVGKNKSLKNPITPPAVEPGTVRLVAQRLNHYAIQGPMYRRVSAKIKNKISLIVTEHHRQSIHGRLPSRMSNKPGYLSHFLGQKSMANKYYILVWYSCTMVSRTKVTLLKYLHYASCWCSWHLFSCIFMIRSPLSCSR